MDALRAALDRHAGEIVEGFAAAVRGRDDSPWSGRSHAELEHEGRGLVAALDAALAARDGAALDELARHWVQTYRTLGLRLSDLLELAYFFRGAVETPVAGELAPDLPAALGALRAVDRWLFFLTSRTAAVWEHHAARRLAESLAEIEAIHRGLTESGIRDSATRAFTYRYFQHQLRAELQRSARFGHPFSVVFVDVVDLPEIGDTYGAAAAERLLQAVAGRIEETTRSVDTVARFGQGRFALLLPETEGAGAARAAERVARVVEAAPYVLPEAKNGGRPLHVRVLAGVATYPTDAESERRLLERASLSMADRTAQLPEVQ